MNILYLCDEYPPGRHGGIGSVVQVQAREMVKRGHRVVVAGFYDWGYGGADEFDDEGVRVYRFRRLLDSKWFQKKDSIRVRATYRLFKSLGIFQYDIERSLKAYYNLLNELILKYGIEVVEKPDFNEYVQYCTKYTPFPKLDVPTIVKLHGSITSIYKGRNLEPPPLVLEMERDVLKKADLVCSVSKDMADRTKAYFNYNKPISVIHNGIWLSHHLHIDKIPGQVVFTGSLVENKGIYQLARAWNIVVKENPNASIWVLGKGNKARVIKNLSPRAIDSVTFMGHVPKPVLQEHLRKASVAVFPSFTEAFSLAPMESMAAGTATIFTKRASGPELIRDNIDGLLVDPAKPEEIAQAILKVLSDDELRIKLERNGRQRIEDEFEMSKVIDKHVSMYEAICRTNQ